MDRVVNTYERERSLKKPTPLSRAFRATLLTLFVLILLAGAAFLLFPSWKPTAYNLLGLNPTTKHVGKIAPELTLPSLHTQKKIRLHSFRGKVILLDFWASWCRDCVRQLPILERIHRDPQYRGKVQVLSINIKDPNARNPAVLKAWLQQRGLTFPVLLGGMKALETYKVRFLPTLLVIDTRGKVTHTSPESHPENTIRAWVKDLLTNPP